MNKNKRAASFGSYSLAMTAVMVAITIAVNVLAGVLPAHITKLDMSSTQLYSVSSNTRAVVNNLDRDVTIYWIVQADAEDEVLMNLLDRYDSLSDHLSVVKKNPDIYPAFAKQYTDEEVMNNSLVVECGDKHRYIGWNDIYVAEADLSTYSYSTAFDGEGQITSAIDYVVTKDLPVLYVLSGHGEPALPEKFVSTVVRSNVEVKELSLLETGMIPEDTGCLMIYAPQTDLATEETQLIYDFVRGGGDLYVIAGPVKDAELSELNRMVSYFGVEVQNGIVVDPEESHFAFQAPYILLPDMQPDAITQPLIDAGYHSVMPMANSLKISSMSNLTVKTLLKTSDQAYLKAAGYGITAYEKEDGDIDGPFILGALISDNSNGAHIAWFTSSNFLEDMYNSYSSGGNVDLAMNTLSEIVGRREAMSIRTKSLDNNYLTISQKTATILKVLLVGVFPVLYLLIGIVVVLNRRRKLK